MKMKVLEKIETMKAGEVITIGWNNIKDDEVDVLKDMIKNKKIFLDPDTLAEEIRPHAHEKYKNGEAIAPYMKYIKA